MKRISLFAALLVFAPGITQAYYGSGVRYSPYALSYYSSGLVPGYGTYADSFSFLVHPGSVIVPRHVSPIVRRVPLLRRAQGTLPPTASPNAMAVIRQHLQAQGLGAVTIDRILRVDNQLVSVDVLVRDRNLLIKYWNPEEVQRLQAKESSQQIAYARYKESWEQYAQRHRQAGGEIYYVNAAEPQAIVAALDACPRLRPGSDTQTVLHAKN